MRLVDITELFMHELRDRGVIQTWYVKPALQAGPLRHEYLKGTEIIVPPTITAGGAVGKTLTLLGYWFFETVFMLRQLAKPPDAILVRDKYWGAVLGYFVARACGAKLLIWLSYPYPEHDTEEAGSTHGWRRLLRRARASLGYRMLYRFAMPRADHCFVQSDQMKRDLLQWGIRPERMTPVPMGISKRVFDSIDVSTPPAMPPVVLYLGTLAGVRKLEILVDTFALVHRQRPDVRFQFVGSGNVPHEREALEKRVHEQGLDGVVQFTGQLPMAEAWKLTGAASVCVSPFRTTPVLRVASPTKFVEYLAFAKPTVGNTHPEHSAIAQASRGALTVEWSPEAFADAILWCLDHPEEAREMAARGREWVRGHRTYERIADMVHQELMRIVLEREPSKG